MARFSGAGTLSSTSGRIRDIEFTNAGLTVSGSDIRVTGCQFTGAGGLTLASGASEVFIAENYIDPTTDDSINLAGNNDQVLITGNYLGGFATNGVEIQGSSHSEITIVGNIFESDSHGVYSNGATIGGLVVSGNTMRPTTHGVFFDTGGSVIGVISDNTIINAGGNGIYIDNESELQIHSNIISEPEFNGILIDGPNNIGIRGNLIIEPGQDTTDTYDGIRIDGPSSRCLVTTNTIHPPSAGVVPRAAVGLDGTGECNMIVGNDLGDPDLYGTAAIVDSASNTQLFWPADATIGDNFGNCGSGS